MTAPSGTARTISPPASAAAAPFLAHAGEEAESKYHDCIMDDSGLVSNPGPLMPDGLLGRERDGI